MLCSVPAGKSSSNWLDRLRSSKGFPTGPDPGLDHFLSAPQTPDTSISEPVQPVQHRLAGQTPDPGGDSGKEWHGIMTDILSELFHTGDPDPLPAKKSSRKQANPRFFPSSTRGVRKIDNALSFNSDNNLVEAAVDLGCRDEGEEEEKEDLAGYSRSEVTVIDTSCPGWKFEKVLYRRKNVWKVRDRKGKGRSGLGRKKRRATGGSSDEIIHGKKKLKRSSSALDSSNEVSLFMIMPSAHCFLACLTMELNATCSSQVC